MLLPRSLAAAALVLLAGLCAATGPPGSRPALLVVIDTPSAADTHARLLSALRARGYTLTVAPASSALPLHAPGAAPGDALYGGIVLLCPTAPAMEEHLPLAALLRFVDAGGAVFAAGAGGYSRWFASVAKAFGVSLDTPASRVVDHQRAVAGLDGGDRTWVSAGGRAASDLLFGGESARALQAGDIVFHGPGAGLFADNELVEAVLWGSGSSYSGEPEKPVTELPHESGSATVLAATLSTRGGARFAYFGSLDALSDAVFDAAAAAHESAVTGLAAWTFGHRGVLRAQNLRYHTDREGAETDGFRVKDDIEFNLDVQVWDGDRGVWGEYSVDDMQLEFVMLNPWVRTRLAPTGNGDNSTYAAVVPVPDQIGIYKFRIAYYRPGVGGLELEEVVPIRPFLHNEYRRFIPMAYPYYAACFTMLASVFMLGLALNFGNAAVATTAAGVGSVLKEESTAGESNSVVKGGGARQVGNRARKRT